MMGNHAVLQSTLIERPAPYDRHVETNQSPVIEVRFKVHEDTLPALYSAVEEISNEIGGRLEAPARYAREDALTRASRALGQLRAGVSDALSRAGFESPLGDKDYR